jgi:hypothetical protein
MDMITWRDGKVMKVNTNTPTPRRKHSINTIGDSIVMFGGFNGTYLNDLHYIDI